jgi:hypothetical protein
MWVAPESRRQGVGRALRDEALSWGRSNGAHRAEPWVVSDNGPAYRMYRSAGLESTGETGVLRAGADIPVVLLATELRASPSPRWRPRRRGVSHDARRRRPSPGLRSSSPCVAATQPIARISFVRVPGTALRFMSLIGKEVQ